MPTYLEAAALTALLEQALSASRVSATNAASVARALVAAQIDGQQGHGLSRLVSYCEQAASGKVDGYAQPQLQRVASAFQRVDAANGFAFPAIDLAIDALEADAAACGIAAIGITRSHHCGQLGAHVERLAQRGLVAIMVANTPKAMAPWGGNAPLLGTNPIAFAAPGGTADDHALVMDLSLSRVARGKVMAAAQRNESIPDNWALDNTGQPTTDPQAALAGSMLPAGDAKGAALALMVEVLAASITGARYSFEASSFFDAEGEPPGVGQLLIGIDAGHVTSGEFATRFRLLCDSIQEQPGARLPGSSRLASRRAVADTGVPVDDAQLAMIRRLTNT